jgi:hypothetical protein
LTKKEKFDKILLKVKTMTIKEIKNKLMEEGNTEEKAYDLIGETLVKFDEKMFSGDTIGAYEIVENLLGISSKEFIKTEFEF